MTTLPATYHSQRGRDLAIVEDMLHFAPCPDIDPPTRAPHLASWYLPRAVGDLLLSDANAFLLGCLFNYQVPYVRALSAPWELQRRLGHLDVARLGGMTWQDLAPSIARGAHGGALHRFPNNLAKR